MHEVDFKCILILIQWTLEQMFLGWHVVALVPICFPLTEDWESWFNLEFDNVIFSLGVRGTNVADVVIIVKASDILWKVS